MFLRIINSKHSYRYNTIEYVIRCIVGSSRRGWLTLSGASREIDCKPRTDIVVAALLLTVPVARVDNDETVTIPPGGPGSPASPNAPGLPSLPGFPLAPRAP